MQLTRGIIVLLLLLCSCTTTAQPSSGLYQEDTLMCIDRSTGNVVLCVKGPNGLPVRVE